MALDTIGMGKEGIIWDLYSGYVERIILKKIKSVAYNYQGSHTGQLDFCIRLTDGITTG